MWAPLIGSLASIVLSVSALASPLFDDDTPVEIELAGPLRATLADRKRGEREFTLTSGAISVPVHVRARGNSRFRLCSFPPLRLDFAAGEADGTVFEGQRKLRLVTHCKQWPAYEQNVLDEYAAYRIFALLSEAAYAVRLLRITYVDTDRSGRKAPPVRYAFAIESNEEFERRTGARAAELPLVSRRVLNRRQEAVVYVFQYLIGNTDWSLVTAKDAEHCCHNGRLKWIGSELFYVPYDFDLAGIVDARYAYPDASLRIRRVTQRLYRGHCLPRDTLRDAVRAVAARRDDITGLLDSLPVVVERDARASREFVSDYFAAAADEEALLDEFEDRCR